MCHTSVCYFPCRRSVSQAEGSLCRYRKALIYNHNAALEMIIVKIINEKKKNRFAQFHTRLVHSETGEMVGKQPAPGE